MTPEWLNESVKAFGRQMGLQSLRLGERDAAGVRFENGYELKLEFVRGYLELLLTFPAESGGEGVRRLLSAAHPDARTGIKLRAGLFASSGRAFLHTRMAEREVAVDALERVFRELWKAALSVGRTA